MIKNKLCKRCRKPFSQDKILAESYLAHKPRIGNLFTESNFIIECNFCERHIRIFIKDGITTITDSALPEPKIVRQYDPNYYNPMLNIVTRRDK